MFTSETKLLLIAFVWAATAIVSVHAVEFPGSVPDFKAITAGQELLDTRPAFEPAAVYDRIQAYGDQGRANYRLRLMTVDVLLPLSLTPFLVLFMRRGVGRFGVDGSKKRLLLATSWAYLVFDLAENAVLLALLFSYPSRNVALAMLLPYVTTMKRAGILGALLIPTVLSAAAFIRNRLRRTSSSGSSGDDLSGSSR